MRRRVFGAAGGAAAGAARVAAGIAATLLAAGTYAAQGDRSAAPGTPAPGPTPTVIGLFVPVRGPDAASGEEARRGAEIAIAAAAGRDGGPGRSSLRLVVAPSNGPWEGATRELVRLIYDERAVAVIGALDGRTAHLAEQVIVRARGQALFLTAWAAEPSLTGIGVPWFFRMVPDDRRQAEALAREIFTARRFERVGLIVQPGFDAAAAEAAFTRLAPPGAIARLDAAAPGVCGGAAGAPQAIVLLAPPRAAPGILAGLRAGGCRLPIFGPLFLATPGLLDNVEGPLESAILAAPPGDSPSPPARLFGERFEARYGRPPTPIAAYTHDAIVSLVEALRRSAVTGTEPATAGDGDRLAAALADAAVEGATGPIRFDGRRDRDGPAGLAVVSRGRLIAPGCACPAEENVLTGGAP